MLRSGNTLSDLPTGCGTVPVICASRRLLFDRG